MEKRGIDQNRDDFYEGPPLEESDHWHDGAVFEEPGHVAGRHSDADTGPPLIAVDPPTGPYPPPDVVERPHVAQPPPAAPRQPTRDPSLSRAVDRAAAGLDPAATGYDRTNEGPPPGPLEPEAEDQAPQVGGGPSGQWGSSG